MKPLNTITRQETGDLELYHPVSGEGLGSFLILAGPRHPIRERLELEMDRKVRAQINKRGSLELDEPEKDRQKALDYLVSITLGWYSLEERDDKSVPAARVDMIDVGRGPEPFSVARVREIYEDKDLGWIREQARAGSGKQELFIKDSSQGSSNTPAGSPASPKSTTPASPAASA